MSIFWKLF